MNRIIIGLVLTLLTIVAQAGQVHLNWVNAPGIAASEISVGSCVDGAYGVDLFSGEYPRIPPDRNDALILQLKSGDTFCFRVRHIYADNPPSDVGIASPWLFIGPVVVPAGPIAGPPIVVPPPPPPAPPTNGSVG